MRACPFAHCGELIPENMFACYRHWLTLDKWQMARIWACYRDYLADNIDLDGLRAIQQEIVCEVEARTVA
jgi:hypothetical protein